MRLTITIDGMAHQIDSTDPELLGKWITEIFGRAVTAGISPATYIQVQIYPSWIPDGAGGKPDWIADTRIIGSTYVIKTPQEIADKLAEQLKDWKELP